MLSGDDAWCAKNIDDQQYIQLDFQQRTRVTAVSTFRRKEKKHWVTKYNLLYSNDDVIWHEYNENGFVKVGTCAPAISSVCDFQHADVNLARIQASLPIGKVCLHNASKHQQKLLR